MRNIFIVLIILIFCYPLPAQQSAKMQLIEHDFKYIPDTSSMVNAIPYNHGLATDSPGDIAGYSFYDQQSIGSSGNRIAVCEDRSVYMCWTKLFGWPLPPAPCHVYFNWISEDGDWYADEEGGSASENTPSLLPTLGAFNDNTSAISYNHDAYDSNVTVAVEMYQPGVGIFDHYYPAARYSHSSPAFSGRMSISSIAIDGNNNIHLVMNEYADRGRFRLTYCRSDDDGITWTDMVLIDTVKVISSVVTTSPVSDKVVIGYAKSCDTTTQWKNDIVYFESRDGHSWNWRYGRHNITDYENDSDSLYAYTDLDFVIDYNDDINAVWNAQWVVKDSVYFRTYLLYYNEYFNEICEITHHPDSQWTYISGAWNRPICKMNLSASYNWNEMVVTWTQFDTSDVAASGFGNGDIYMSSRYENNNHWYYMRNITCSASPGCQPGECANDNWSSLAENYNGYSINLIYINDKDAGSCIYNEGCPTENPINYLEYWMVDNTRIVDNIPSDYILSQNYPNPFNQTTTISFELPEPEQVSLEIYDITGALVETLIKEHLPAGVHKINWNADKLASGTYIYRLKAGEQSEVNKAVLIK